MSSLAQYLHARIDEDGAGDCWRWTGYAYNGHPGGTFAGCRFLARRAMYELRNGAIPAGRIIQRVCETPLCVNPEHLKLTTHKSVANEVGARGGMSGPVRSARIAAAKRTSSQAKITQEQARDIRISDEAPRLVAERYGARVGERDASKLTGRAVVRRCRRQRVKTDEPSRLVGLDAEAQPALDGLEHITVAGATLGPVVARHGAGGA